jgi:hypothetical protein
MISSEEANGSWRLMYENSTAADRAIIERLVGQLCVHPDDWVLDALHQPFFKEKNSIADGVAYAWLMGAIIGGRVHMCLVPVERWACADIDVAANEKILASGNFEGRIASGSDGYDGHIRYRGTLGMVQLYIDDASTPTDVGPAFWDEWRTKADDYPLEIGYCALSKSVGILMVEGRLARLPYGPLKFGADLRPHVYCFTYDRGIGTGQSVQLKPFVDKSRRGDATKLKRFGCPISISYRAWRWSEAGADGEHGTH